MNPQKREAERMDRLEAGRQPSRGDQDQTSEFLQRWAPLIAGGALAAYGLSRRSKGGVLAAAAGAAVAYQGVKWSGEPQRNFARATVVVNGAQNEVYRFWRQFENLPRFMHHLDSVQRVGDGQWKWTAIGPAGKPISWIADIVAERENDLIAWRSVQGSDIQVDGVVEFRPATGNRGTMVDVMVQYRPPTGAGGRALMKLLGKDPSWLMRQDLRRFKALLEAGEIPTIEGQSHGPRSGIATAARLFDPDQPLGADLNRSATEKRRVS
jgi:uncharacterized membrane protein